MLTLFIEIVRKLKGKEAMMFHCN